VTRSGKTWLKVVSWVLNGILVLNVVLIPLLVFAHGSPRVATVDVGALFSGDPYVKARQHLPGLNLSQMSVYADRPTVAQDLLYSLGNGLAVMLVLIPLLVSAIRLVEHASRYDPFTPQMVRRLRRLGVLVLVLGLLSSVAEYAAQKALLRISLPHDDTLHLNATIGHYPTLWWLIPGLMLLAFSEIVRHGCDLRAELDEVI
jgi:Protein of unknown function (DUF2975)